MFELCALSHAERRRHVGYALVANVIGARRAKVETIARSVGLGDYLERRPGQLSGGQRQRVAMARAMIREPRVFLFDEPLSNLDAQLRVQMRAEIRKLHRQLGTTSVFVTHDQAEAMTLADRLVVMRNGRVEQVGTPGEIYKRSGDALRRRLHRLSPPMNLLDGVIDAEGSFQAFGGSAKLALGRRDLAGRGVSFGVRPEALHVVPRGTGSLDATLDFVEELGAGRVLHFDWQGTTLAVAQTTAAVGVAGRCTRPCATRRTVPLFAAESGERLVRHRCRYPKRQPRLVPMNSASKARVRLAASLSRASCRRNASPLPARLRSVHRGACPASRNRHPRARSR